MAGKKSCSAASSCVRERLFVSVVAAALSIVATACTDVIGEDGRSITSRYDMLSGRPANAGGPELTAAEIANGSVQVSSTYLDPLETFVNDTLSFRASFVVEPDGTASYIIPAVTGSSAPDDEKLLVTWVEPSQTGQTQARTLIPSIGDDLGFGSTIAPNWGVGLDLGPQKAIDFSGYGSPRQDSPNALGKPNSYVHTETLVGEVETLCQVPAFAELPVCVRLIEALEGVGGRLNSVDKYFNDLAITFAGTNFSWQAATSSDAFGASSNPSMVLNARTRFNVWEDQTASGSVTQISWHKIVVDLRFQPRFCGGCAGGGRWDDFECDLPAGPVYDETPKTRTAVGFPGGAIAIPSSSALRIPSLDIGVTGSYVSDDADVKWGGNCIVFAIALAPLCAAAKSTAESQVDNARDMIPRSIGDGLSGLATPPSLIVPSDQLVIAVTADLCPPSCVTSPGTCPIPADICEDENFPDLAAAVAARGLDLGLAVASIPGVSGVRQLGAEGGVWTPTTLQAFMRGAQVQTVFASTNWLAEYLSSTTGRFPRECTGDPQEGPECTFVRNYCMVGNTVACRNLANAAIALPTVLQVQPITVPPVPELGRLLQVGPAFATAFRHVFAGPLGDKRPAGATVSGSVATFHFVDADAKDRDCVPSSTDNCEDKFNPTQTDSDGDDIGNVCDGCPAVPGGAIDADRDGLGDVCDCDLDGDACNNLTVTGGNGGIVFCPQGAGNTYDRNPLVTSRSDTDGDGIKFDCDNDKDGDEVPDILDNCPEVANNEQVDANDDDEGDECDSGCQPEWSFDEDCPYEPGRFQVTAETLSEVFLRNGGLPQWCLDLSCNQYTALGLPPCLEVVCRRPESAFSVELINRVQPTEPYWAVTPELFGGADPFGRVVALSSDFTSDGRRDPLVALPWYDACVGAGCADAGRIALLDSFDGSEAWSYTYPTAQAQFGTEIARFGSRAYVGAPGATNPMGVRTGSVLVFELGSRQPELVAQYYGSSDGERFGETIVPFVYDERLIALFVGAPRASVGNAAEAGRIDVISNQGERVAAFQLAVPGAHLGTRIAAIPPQPLQEDPGALVAGIPDAFSEAGGVVAFHYNGEVRAVRYGAVAGERLGEQLIAGDIDGSGYTYTAVSAPGASGGDGRVVVMNHDLVEVDALIGPSGSGLGRVMTLPGDMDGDSVPDLAMAMPDLALPSGIAENGVWLQWAFKASIAPPACTLSPGGCPGPCSSGMDTDGDGTDDCSELFDDDPWTDPFQVNGMDVRAFGKCHLFPSCDQIDTLSEVEECVDGTSPLASLLQHTGWNWIDPPDWIGHSAYHFLPNWSLSALEWSADWRGYVNLAEDGYHCFDVGGRRFGACTSLFFHDEASDPAQTGMGPRCYQRAAGTYPIRWFYEMSLLAISDQQVRYCFGGSAPCTPSQELPAAMLRADRPLSACIPKTCSQLGAVCGTVDDGCGNTLNCDLEFGACPAPFVCGGDGVPNRCDCPSGQCYLVGADSDGDGILDSSEFAMLGDNLSASTFSAVFNGALVTQGPRCHLFPSCWMIDDLNEVTLCSGGDETLAQYAGWSFNTPDDSSAAPGYGFAPNWSVNRTDFKVDAKALMALSADGFHCFSITGGTTNQCGAFFFDNATAAAVTNGSVKCYQRPSGVYPIHWFYETQGNGSHAMTIKYCYNATGSCTPTAVLPSSKLVLPGTVTDLAFESPSPDFAAFEAPAEDCSLTARDGRLYWACDDAATWDVARTTCEYVPTASLVRVDSAAENNLVGYIIDSTSWIGGNDLAVEGSWRWSAGDTAFWNGTAWGSPVSGMYTNWTTGEPDGGGSSDCAVIEKTGSYKWRDKSCLESRPFVCEVAIDVCEADPNKLLPGACGCGIADTDTDDDGTADCQDECPLDAEQDSAGACGCANNPAPSGTPCTDAVCVSASTCDGEGLCIPLSQCPPPASGQPPEANCVLRGTNYWICPTHRSWQDARARCVAVGKDLVHITDAAANGWLRSEVSQQVWLGGNDIASEGQWVWSNDNSTFWVGGTFGSPTAYANWDLLQPDNFLSQDCALLDNLFGKWRDESCSSSKAYVCR